MSTTNGMHQQIDLAGSFTFPGTSETLNRMGKMLQLRDNRAAADTDTELNAHQAHEQRTFHDSSRIATMA
jgi:hypothetical protein